MDALEDLGYYCMDNLPARLLPALANEMADSNQLVYEHAAVAIDARNPAEALQGLPGLIRELRLKDHVHDLVFLAADDASLIRRFSETRRKHPLTAPNVSLAEAIGRERELLAPLRLDADIVIDTSRTHLHQLRAIVRQRIAQRAPGTLSVLFQSFGYKHGVPADADIVFDVRCLPNPYWETQLRPLTGKDTPVIEFLESQHLVEEMFESLKVFLQTWLPRFEAENRAYVTVGIGCTGGRHRSVYLTERLVAYFRAQRFAVLARHRELS